VVEVVAVVFLAFGGPTIHAFGDVVRVLGGGFDAEGFADPCAFGCGCAPGPVHHKGITSFKLIEVVLIVMKAGFVGFYEDPEIIDILDNEAAKRGINRSGLLRLLIRETFLRVDES
jgi:hypothetical protein